MGVVKHYIEKKKVKAKLGEEVFNSKVFEVKDYVKTKIQNDGCENSLLYAKINDVRDDMKSFLLDASLGGVSAIAASLGNTALASGSTEDSIKALSIAGTLGATIMLTACVKDFINLKKSKQKLKNAVSQEVDLFDDQDMVKDVCVVEACESLVEEYDR